MLGCGQGSVHGRQSLLPPPRAPETRDHGRKTALSWTTQCLTSAHGPIPSPEPEQSLTSPPVSAHSPSTKPFAGRGQLLPKRAGREWENTQINVGSAGMSRRKADRQLWNPPLPSLPAGNSRIIPNIACGQGALGSFSIIPELRNTSCPQG